MKKLFAIILSTALLTGLLAGCNGKQAASSSTTSTSASASASASPVSISLWIMPLYDTFIDTVKAKFPPAIQAEYPNVTLNTELLSWDAGPEKLTVAMATNATPDFMQDGLSRLASGITAGLCADVTDLMSKLKPIILEGFLKEGMKDGKNYYVPTNTSNGYDFCVNATLAKELGVYDLLPADKIHWSYDQFLNFCRKATAAGQSKGIYAAQLWAGSRSSDAVYYSFLMAGGSKITDMSKKPPVVAANSAAAEVSLNVLKTLVDEKLVPDGAATTKDEGVDPNFESGKLVLLLDTAGAQEPITVYNKAKSGDIKGFATEIIQIPTPDGKADPYVASWGTSGFVVFKNSNDAAKIQAAKDAIEIWAKTTEIGTEVSLKGGAAPTFNNITLDYGDTTLNAQVKFASEANAKYSHSDFGILEGWWSSFRETFYVQLQGIYTGTKTVKQALSDWETTGNAAIAKALEGTK